MSVNSLQTQFIETVGAKIAFDYSSAIQSPTHLLILVNGFQRTRQDFRAFRKNLQKFAPHVATVAFDNRYCGETQVSAQNCDINVMSQDVLAVAKVFMQKLNLKSFSVLGISMGGMIVQNLASHSPEGLLENLFLVSTTAGGAGRTWSSPVQNPSELKYTDKNVDLESTKKNMTRYFADKFLKKSPLLFEMMCKNMMSNSVKNSSHVNANIQFNLSVSFDSTNYLNNIKTKNTVIISGDEDYIIPVENSYYLNKSISNSRLIIYPQVGHLILIEEPHQFVQDVSSYFLQKEEINE